MTREKLARDLMIDCPAEAREDHEAIGRMILSGETEQTILQSAEADRWPDTYVWLKDHLPEVWT